MLVPNPDKPKSDYRYGFNGKENDNEIMGEGNFQDYGMRMYNPRIGRFFNIDPLIKKYPELTPYQFASNTPIQSIDLDGLEQYHYTLSFNKEGKPQLTYLNVTHLKTLHYRWGSKRIMGAEIPIPEGYLSEDRSFTIHTGKIHEGLTPDNSEIYRMEISRRFDTRQGMLNWASKLTPEDLQKFDDKYAILDQAAHHLSNVQEIYQESRPGSFNDDWEILPTNTKFDQGAQDLAEEIGGVAQARFRNSNREYDAISDKFIGQHKPGVKDNIGQTFKNQAKASFQAAKATGREVYYKFDKQPGEKVIQKLNEYSERYKVKVHIKY